MSSQPHKKKHGWLIAACALAAFTSLGQTAPSGHDQQPESTKTPATQPTTQPRTTGDPSVRTPPQVSAEDLLKEFQKQRPKALPILPTAGPDEEIADREAPPSGGGRRMPDGYFLVDRVGRLTRDGEWWVFTFEGYNETHPEPPMKMLPNQLLERMVIESEGAGGSTVFVVSGEVTEFKGENYLLLRKLLHRRTLGNLEK